MKKNGTGFSKRKRLAKLVRMAGLLCFSLLFVVKLSAENYSQQTRLKVDFNQATLKEVMSEIQHQTGLAFFYSDDVLDSNRRISLNSNSMALKDVLLLLKKQTGLSFSVVRNQILVQRINSDQVVAPKSLSVSGKVTDSSGSPLPGVTVAVKGTTSGIITDSEGHYELTGVNANAVLIFSFVGMKSQQIPVSGKSEINVKMADETIGLEEVVAIGYGTVKKSDLTGSVGVIKTEQLDQRTNNNLGSALQGKISGVTVESNGGAPGAGMDINIRGEGSLNNNNPLILVDDIAVSSMNNLDPNDIESIQVLKDASAAAIYGSRAANGVILITTKGGEKGPARINFSVDYGIQKLEGKQNLCTTDEWTKVITEACAAAGDDVPAIAENPEEPGTGVDWQDEVYRVAPVQNYSLGMSGGAALSNYSISLNYLNQDGIMDKTGYDRLNFRVKSDFTKGRLKIGESVLLTKETSHDMPGVGGQGGNVTGATIMMIPAFSIYDEDAVGGYGGASGSVLDVFNPVAALNLLKSKTEYYKALANLFAEVKIIKGLKYKLSIGATYNNKQNTTTNAAYSVGAFFTNTENYAYKQSALTKYWQIDNTLSYNNSFGKHSVNAVVGYTTFKNRYDEFDASKKGMADGIWELSAGSDDPTANGEVTENTMISYLGRIIYSFDNRYIFTGTFRRDGSSRFSSSKRWGNFPSVSAAWNVANESFFQNLAIPVSQLKLRGSYGKLGNQEIGDYQYTAGITSGVSYVKGTSQDLWTGAIQTDYVPTNLKWESTATSDVGLDLGLWRGKLNYTLDLYKKTTTDLLLKVPLPLSAGSDDDPYSNAGKVLNKGFEMMLNYNGNYRKFKYSVTGTLSHLKNRVEELATGSQVLTGSDATHGGSAVTYTKVGYPIYSFFLIKTDGLFRSDGEVAEYTKDGQEIQPNAQAGDYRFVDANNDGQISGDGDRVYCGSPFPKYEYGLRLEGTWKFIDASVYFQGTHGNKIYNGIRTYTESGVYTCEYSKDLLNSYSFNSASDIPRLDLNDPNGNGNDNTDRFLEDGSYLRLKTVEIGFTFPQRWTDRLSLQKCRLYVGANNPVTWTKYKGYNPDIGNSSISSRGIDFRQYPLNRSYHVGFQLNF